MLWFSTKTPGLPPQAAPASDAMIEFVTVAPPAAWKNAFVAVLPAIVTFRSTAVLALCTAPPVPPPATTLPLRVVFVSVVVFELT